MESFCLFLLRCLSHYLLDVQCSPLFCNFQLPPFRELMKEHSLAFLLRYLQEVALLLVDFTVFHPISYSIRLEEF